MSSARGRALTPLVVIVLAGVHGGCAGGPVPAPSTPPATTSSEAMSPGAAQTLPTVGEAFLGARTFALAAESGRVEGVLARGKGTVEVVLEGDAAGGNERVVVDQGDAGVAEVLVVGDGHWLGGDEAFWATRDVSAGDTATASRTYLRVSSSEAASVAPWTLRSILTARFAQVEVAALESDTSPVVEETLHGEPVWRLGRDGGPRLWVAADGSARLVRMVVPAGDVTDVTFSAWGRARTVAAPSGGDVRT